MRTPWPNRIWGLKILTAGMDGGAWSIPVLLGPALFPKRQDHLVLTIAMQNHDFHPLQTLPAAKQ